MMRLIIKKGPQVSSRLQEITVVVKNHFAADQRRPYRGDPSQALSPGSRKRSTVGLFFSPLRRAQSVQSVPSDAGRILARSRFYVSIGCMHRFASVVPDIAAP
jgi:hypothetical protein